MVSEYLLLFEEKQISLSEWFGRFDWDSEEDLTRGIRRVIVIFYNDEFLRSKNVTDYSVNAGMIYKQIKKIAEDENRLVSYSKSTASYIWDNGMSRAKLDAKTARLFSESPDKRLYLEAVKEIKEIYSLTDNDIQKIHYFVEQVKAGGAFPNSLRRMLYIWSKNKKTGKTTIANAIICLLNGDEDTSNISNYSSFLAYEMQIKNFSIPRISECNAVLMDECFYADMGKTYADFKKFMTSSGGRARKPYGQEYIWVGYPNYIATSNESLGKFIKDWDDRRYLSVELSAAPTKKMSEVEIMSLWKKFVVNSQKDMSWNEWTDKIYDISNEVGEKGTISSELEIELKQSDMINIILNTNIEVANDERITLKKWIQWLSLSLGAQEANKRRTEIEQAVINVYGNRYSSSNYWRLSDLQKKAKTFKDELLDNLEMENLKLPF